MRTRYTELDLMMMRAGRTPFDVGRMQRDFAAAATARRRATATMARHLRRAARALEAWAAALDARLPDATAAR